MVANLVFYWEKYTLTLQGINKILGLIFPPTTTSDLEGGGGGGNFILKEKSKKSQEDLGKMNS